MTTALVGCATSGSPAPRDLPTWPGFARPVAVQDPQAGEPLLAIAARERAGRVENARRLEEAQRWYAGVRESYSEERR